ncbi:FAD-binding monooxygenase ktnD [Penicillium macrosclerotiorum]|uniref:FAD-binding monooxygenase ktnD n=1 Tax=Penicillium macrosclerotiorum TaxID=303699 RepID=UPI0025472C9D|nr:FAD-binding monooxygenase ktnD [Penicillium macrosclerotiorum]KAJ5689875.1 FAD-binding monooxygenase ktnD [Penicillium macrosclerotiorum]
MTTPYSSRLPVGNKDFTNATVVIIGAGISGMNMAIDLIKRNKCRNFVILEKSSNIGGTWNDNKYPGCCCDVWSALYSYSFEQKSNWSREYPGQEEIYAYLVDIAEKHGLYKHIRFNSTVEEARWDDSQSKWNTTVKVTGQKDSEFSNSYLITSEFLISAVGQLNAPQTPNIPGLDDFNGKLMHSARWDWSYDLANKKIAVIGNGATAAQIIPDIAPIASHLTVFQRTPNWLIPRLDKPVSSLQRALLTYVPPLRWRKRALQMEYREAFHSAVFDSDSDYAQMVRDWCEGMLKSQLPNKPELWEALTPKYSPGCKRLILSDDYYPAIARENVDLETRPITRITEKGIEVEGAGEQEYDLIVLATGFRTVDFMYPIQVYGSGGRPLAEIWKNGARAYYGVTVEDLPNFGMFYGPNTNLGHNSIILMIEAQSRYLNALVGKIIHARRMGKTLSLKPAPNVVEEYNERIQALLRNSSFADPKCNSWYKRADGIITNNWSGTVFDYQRELSKVKWEDYVIEGSGQDTILNKNSTYIGRVHEELYLSNTSLLFGAAASVLAMAGGYIFARPRLVGAR